MLIKHSLSIYILETCTTVSVSIQYVMEDLFNFICTELATVIILYIATKDKFEVLHLPDLTNNIQFPSLFCLFLHLELIGIKEIF